MTYLIDLSLDDLGSEVTGSLRLEDSGPPIVRTHALVNDVDRATEFPFPEAEESPEQLGSLRVHRCRGMNAHCGV
jgi:hypothetical protein